MQQKLQKPINFKKPEQLTNKRSIKEHSQNHRESLPKHTKLIKIKIYVKRRKITFIPAIYSACNALI